MKLNETRIFFGPLLLAFAGVVATTPAHAAQPPAATQPAPAPTAPTTAQPATAQPAPAGTAPATAAPAGAPITTEVQTTTQTVTTTTQPAPSAVKPAPPVMHAERRLTAPVIGAGVVGGVAIVAGVVFAVLANKDKGDYNDKSKLNTKGVQDAPSDLAANETAVSGEKKAFAADICFGLGALFGLAAVALYFLPDEPVNSPTGTAKVVPPLGSRSAKSWMKSAVTGRLEF